MMEVGKNMSLGLMDRLPVSIDRDWVVAQMEAIESLSFWEKVSAGKCLGRFDREAWSMEEVAFLSNGKTSLERVREIATVALDHCDRQAPTVEVRTELARIRTWLFTEI